MARKFLTPIDLNKNELQNARLQNLATAPGSPVAGQIYYDSGNNTIRLWNGTAWQTIATGTVADATTTTKGIIQLAGDLTGTAASPTIANGAITNAKISAAAAIARSKLDFGSGLVNADIATNAAIAQSKLSLAITNSEVAAAAGIAYSKLNLGNSVVNADIASSAAIALSKLATDPLARANHTGTQLASTISNFDAQVRTSRLDQMAAPTAAVSLNGQKITSLADPTAAQDGATKAYVDGVAQGINWTKARVASTANVNVASPGASVDGVTLANGDRVLLKDQTTASQNGLYIWNGASTAMTRAPDMDVASEVDGKVVIVELGTQAGTMWITVSMVTTLGTDPIVFTQFNSAADITAGNGLTRTGNTLAVNTDGSTVEIVSNQIRVKDGGITSAKILDGTIVNADISNTAAIARSKLDFGAGLVNADISASAAIALSKLATDPLARANHTGTQLASTISNFDTQVRTSRLDQMAAPTAAVSLNSQKITNLGTPTAINDAATKAYVDADGWKIPVVVASQANVNIASPGATIDGVTLSAGDRVLLTAQTTQSQNGIYDWNGAASPMTRSADALDATLLPVGSRVSVKSGTYTGAMLVMTGSFAAPTWTSNVVLGSAASVSGNAAGQVAFLAGATTYFFDPSNGLAMQGKRITGLGDPTAAQDAATKNYVDTNGATAIVAGNGLTKTGNTLDVNADGSTLEIVGNQVRVKDGGVTGAKIANSTIDLTTKVTGALPIANGGTGQTGAKAARETGLAAAGYFTAATNPAATTWSIPQSTHGLRASKGLLVQLQDEASGDVIEADVMVAATGDVSVGFAVAPTANSIRCTIVG